LTTLLAIGLPSNVSSIRLAWMIKTFFLSHNDELMPCLQGEGTLEDVLNSEQKWNKGNNQVRCEVWQDCT
jgi:hypothetical protein